MRHRICFSMIFAQAPGVLKGVMQQGGKDRLKGSSHAKNRGPAPKCRSFGAGSAAFQHQEELEIDVCFQMLVGYLRLFSQWGK